MRPSDIEAMDCLLIDCLGKMFSFSEVRTHVEELMSDDELDERDPARLVDNFLSRQKRAGAVKFDRRFRIWKKLDGAERRPS